jgi:AAA domain
MRIDRDDVLVIDEASQISTTDLAAIQAVATAAGARIVLTGDTAQLGAVEAGGMMRLIASDLGHWELAEVRRFDAAWERLASLQLRRGERAALRAYDTRGRIRGSPQPQAQAEAVNLYLADYLLGRDVLLLAGTNEEAARLAAQVRAELVKLGQVPAQPEVILADGNGAATGDLVRARLNTHLDAAGQPLSNRDTLRLAGWAGTGKSRVAIVQRQLSAGGWSREFPIPADYLRMSAELAYAGNVYVAQGRTVDTAHLYVSPTLTRETLYVGMTRGREANTAHVVTGPARAPGQEPMAQAEPEAVLADILHHVASSTTATEAMREAQAFATSTRHLFTMWSAATRAQAYTDIDAALAARLTPYEYARYQREPQRPVVQRQILAATLSGAALEDVADVATRGDMCGARSIAAVMHGRLKTAGIGQAGRGQTVTWAERTPVAARRGVAGHLADAMDARREELGRQLYEQPERWVLTHLGPPPPESSSQALIADWQMRAGIAASYREAAGIEDPDVAIGLAPQGHPELAEAYAAALLALEIPDAQAQVRAMTRGELERDVAAYTRLKATAPAEPSRELRAASMTEVDARATVARLQAEGQAEIATVRRLHAGTASVQAFELEGRLETYRRWEKATAEDRTRADRAMKELARRGWEAWTQAERHVAAEAGQERPVGESMSLVDQVRRDMANLAALDAKLENAAGIPEHQPESGIEPEELAPSDPNHRAAMDSVDAALTTVVEAQAEAAQRDTSRQAYMLHERQAEAEATGPSVWVPGSRTPSWDSPASYTEQPAVEVEAEASL